MVFYWAQPFEMVFFPTEHEKTQPNQPKTLDPSGAPQFLGLLNSTTWKRRVLIEKREKRSAFFLRISGVTLPRLSISRTPL